jgi:hypothetical protein
VGPRAGLDTEATGKILCLYSGSNNGNLRNLNIFPFKEDKVITGQETIYEFHVLTVVSMKTAFWHIVPCSLGLLPQEYQRYIPEGGHLQNTFIFSFFSLLSSLPLYIFLSLSKSFIPSSLQEYHRHFMDSLAYANAIPPVPPQFHPLEVILLWISQHIF